MYRGIDINTGEQVFGYYCKIMEEHYILTNNVDIREFEGGSIIDDFEFVYRSDFIKVHPESIAMNTTMHDKNKKPIYGSITLPDGTKTRGGDKIVSYTTKKELVIYFNYKIGVWMTTYDMDGLDGAFLSSWNLKHFEISGNQWKV